MKVKFVMVGTIIDIGSHWMLQTEDGKLGHVRIPYDPFGLEVVEIVPDSVEPPRLRSIVERLLGSDNVELENSGDIWNNITDADGMVDHPFEDSKVLFSDLEPQFSNYFDEDWKRKFPEDVKAKLQPLVEFQQALKEQQDQVTKQINEIVNKEYY